MKKILALLLALVMLFVWGAIALAANSKLSPYIGKISQITNDVNLQVSPSMYGDYIVWEEPAKPGQNPTYTKNFKEGVYLYNTKTKLKTRIADSAMDGIKSTSIYGNYVAWVGLSNKDIGKDLNDPIVTRDLNFEIYLYNISDKTTIQLTNGGQNSYPSIYGNKVVWVGNGQGDEVYYRNIYMYDIETKELSKITNACFDNFMEFFEPKIYGDNVVFYGTDRNANNWAYYVYIYKISQKTLTRIGKGSYPAIYADNVVYISDPNIGRADMFLYNISSGETIKVNTGVTRPLNFSIFRNKIIYDDNIHFGKGAFLYDISSGQKKELFRNGISDVQIYKNSIIWRENIPNMNTNEYDNFDDIFMWTPSTGSIEGWFKDVGPNHWAFNIINNLVDSGYIKGFNNGEYRPKANVTRAEFMVMLGNILHNKYPEGSTYPQLDETDIISSKHWAYNGVRQTLEHMSVNDFNMIFSGSFKPDNYITREEVAAIISAVTANHKNFSRMSGENTSFKDIDQCIFSDSVIFVLQNGLMNGYPSGEFKPQNPITRAEIASVLSNIVSKL